VKKILLILLITFNLFGAELEFAHDYKSALKQAKQENKQLLVIITSETCKWCRKLEATTLKDADVIKRINKNFIAVHITRDKGDYPSILQAKMVPMTYFLDTKGDLIMHGVAGYWNSEDYYSIIGDAEYKVDKKKKQK